MSGVNGAVLGVGPARPIDDRFGPVPASRSESLRFNFRAEGAGFALRASSSSALRLAASRCDHGICKLAGERGDRNKCTPQAQDLAAITARTIVVAARTPVAIASHFV